MKIKTLDRTEFAQIILDAMAAGTTSSPTIELYTGTIPSSMGGAIGDTLLATLTLTNTVGTVSNGVLTLDAITEDASADAAGIIGWARALDRDGVEAAYFTVADNGTGDINFASVDISAGQPVGISSFTITVGGA
ncbi:hypothetical protein [Marinobacter pelagius]|uniref:Uncharacterized protein n=1 Tax=Marinobacter pelagius TaxID=379482 RepID=A0A1I4T3P2_9GAMM|nr:hypothetical protein [Marinobacter pelagius]SFM71247.1 hypothetical protein SAMN04487961_0980 [Marinobacter pelagius]